MHQVRNNCLPLPVHLDPCGDIAAQLDEAVDQASLKVGGRILVCMVLHVCRDITYVMG